MGARERARARPKPVRPNSSAWVDPRRSQVPSLEAQVRAQALDGWQTVADTAHREYTEQSMKQAARNTGHHERGWASTPIFRQNPIVFVSSGNLQLEEKKDELEENVCEHEQDPLVQPPPSGEEAEHVQTLEKGFEERVGGLEISTATAEAGTSTTHPRKMSVSSMESDEFIVFAGRHGASDATPRQPRTQAKTSDAVVPEVDNTIVEEDDGLQEPPALVISAEANEHSRDNGKCHVQDTLPVQSNGTQRMLEESALAVSDEDEAVMRDYIENVNAHNDEDSEFDAQPESSTSQNVAKTSSSRNEHFRYYDGAPEEKVKVRPSHTYNKKALTNPDPELVWDSGDLEDFDDLSTTDDEIDGISQVLRHRERPSGLQYLVTAVGCDASDAKWLSAWKMTSASAREEIRIFEEILALKIAEDLEDEDESTDNEEAEALDDLIKNINSEDDENTKIMEATSKMTDEQIAHALAKQEEWGLNGDEVLLFDGQAVQDEFDCRDGFIPFSTKDHTSNRTRSKQAKRGKGRFPPAAAFADALDEDPYGAFDVMDFDRPSLKPKKKGRKGNLPFELEEEDAGWADKFSEVWSKDRDKKAARKREREELRAAGMLGAQSRNGQADLHARYSNVIMDADQIRSEIRTFLVEEFESLSLGAMDANMRASVHRLAKALQLKSHSHGTGNDRHPILTKTAFTPAYTENTIWEIDNLLNQRKFFPRSNGSNRSFENPKTRTPGSGRRVGGGGALSGATYMDGEEVAASVPAIAADNKGRAMLEKLGWTSGTGLGALGNEGRVDPIKHIVKTTKAGLG